MVNLELWSLASMNHHQHYHPFVLPLGWTWIQLEKCVFENVIVLCTVIQLDQEIFYMHQFVQ